jgi:hypothetical protein
MTNGKQLIWERRTQEDEKTKKKEDENEDVK